MAKYKVYSYREVKEILKNNGYSVNRVKGDHTIWTNGKTSITININPNPLVIRRLFRTYNLKEV